MNTNNSTELARAAFILHLMPTLDARYAHLRGLLTKAEQGEFINDADLWLAHSDLSGVVNLLLTTNQDNDEEL